MKSFLVQGQTVHELRRAFDESFAAAPVVAGEIDELLAIGVAGAPYALRVRDLALIVSGRKVVPLPSARPGLLGLAGIRGSLVPIFSLATLLGGPPSFAPDPWIAVTPGLHPLGLAFASLEGLVRVPRADIGPCAQIDAVTHCIREVATMAGFTRPILDVVSAVNALKALKDVNARTGKTEPRGEENC